MKNWNVFEIVMAVISVALIFFGLVGYFFLDVDLLTSIGAILVGITTIINIIIKNHGKRKISKSH